MPPDPESPDPRDRLLTELLIERSVNAYLQRALLSNTELANMSRDDLILHIRHLELLLHEVASRAFEALERMRIHRVGTEPPPAFPRKNET